MPWTNANHFSWRSPDGLAFGGGLVGLETQRGDAPRTKGEMLDSLTEAGLDALGGAPFLAVRRHAAYAAASDMAAPSERDEVWRYSPIDRLELNRFALAMRADGPLPVAAEALLGAIGEVAAVVVVRNGHIIDVDRQHLFDDVIVGSSEGAPHAAELLGSVQVGGDLLIRLNDAYLPDVVVVDVPKGVTVGLPIVIVQVIDAPEGGQASFPRTLLHLGQDAEATVIEVFIGTEDDDALVVPVTETIVDSRARLNQISVQLLGTRSWFLARQAATVDRDATLRAFSVGLGGAYDRTRSDVGLIGQGATSQQRSVYFGSDDQVHDIRTLQDHIAPRTQSNLLCKGAVADHSRSIYSGLIRVQNGAVRSDAVQTNHNLVLGEGAHADSVPNLDILENDVTCSHASTVGPIDEDQRYYLESRGIEPAAAERLIITGFFDDVILAIPAAGLATYLSGVIHERLSATALGLTHV